jgi:hypothetical protein
VVATVLAALIVSPAAGAAVDPEVWIGSPYKGYWASSDGCSRASYPTALCSAPKYHHVAYARYDGTPELQSWAADLANIKSGTPVVLYAAPQKSSTPVTAKVQNVGSACPAGPSYGGYVVVVAIYSGSTKIGTVLYAHIQPTVKQGATINRWGTKLGTVGTYKRNSCWTGVHIHVEMGNMHNYSCYNKGWKLGSPYGSPMQPTNFIGFIGGRRTSGPRMPCP